MFIVLHIKKNIHENEKTFSHKPKVGNIILCRLFDSSKTHISRFMVDNSIVGTFFFKTTGNICVLLILMKTTWNRLF